MRKILLSVALLAFCTAGWAQNISHRQDMDVSAITFWQSVSAEADVNTTGTTVDLSANSRDYSSQVLYLYNNTSSADLEWALGGKSITTCSGASPVTEIVASETYEVSVASLSGLARGKVIEIYDADASNAVLLKGTVVGHDSTNSKITVDYISGTTPANAAASDVIGGPNRYTFTTGTGHLIQDVGRQAIVPLSGYPHLHLRASTGTVKARVVQGN